MKKKYNNKGVTLIELLIVLAIMGIVLQLLYSIFFVGNKSFNTSKDRGFAQQDVRIVSTLITNELKNAKEISFEKLEGDYYSLRYNSKDKILYKDIFNKDIKQEKKILFSKLKKVSFKQTKKGFINIIIKSEEGKNSNNKKEYELVFDLLLENIPNYESTNKSSNSIIYYSKYE